MRKLIEHWAEHNDEHRAKFLEAAEEASAKGLSSVAESLRAAADVAGQVSKHLLRALEAF